MKKRFGLLTIVAVAVLGLSGCQKSNLITLRVGASPTPHALILEHVKPILAEQGYNLVIEEFQDYVLPNVALTQGDIDANYFQHVPYLNQYNQDNSTTIANAAGIHIEPIGIYSKNYTNLNDVPNGTTVIMSSSVSDRGRLLALLEQSGLITLVSTIDPYVDLITDIGAAIESNPKGLIFSADVDAGLLVQTYNYEQNSLVLINTNYALDGGLNPLEDALVLESGTQSNPYVNLIAVRDGDEDEPGIVALIEVLLSDAVQQWIITEFEGAVVPAVRP